MQAFEHLKVLGITSAEAYRALLGEFAARIEHERPVASRVVEEGAAPHEQCSRRIAEREAHLQCLAAAQGIRRRTEELEVDFELAVRYLRIDLGHGEGVRLIRERELGGLLSREPRYIEFIDTGLDLVVVDVVDLAEPLGGPHRGADLGIEGSAAGPRSAL